LDKAARFGNGQPITLFFKCPLSAAAKYKIKKENGVDLMYLDCLKVFLHVPCRKSSKK